VRIFTCAFYNDLVITQQGTVYKYIMCINYDCILQVMERTEVL